MRGDVANITENPFGSHPHGDPVITKITAKLLKGERDRGIIKHMCCKRQKEVGIDKIYVLLLSGNGVHELKKLFVASPTRA
jgi:hypothetical protein